MVETWLEALFFWRMAELAEARQAAYLPLRVADDWEAEACRAEQLCRRIDTELRVHPASGLEDAKGEFCLQRLTPQERAELVGGALTTIASYPIAGES